MYMVISWWEMVDMVNPMPTCPAAYDVGISYWKRQQRSKAGLAHAHNGGLQAVQTVQGLQWSMLVTAGGNKAIGVGPAHLHDSRLQAVEEVQGLCYLHHADQHHLHQLPKHGCRVLGFRVWDSGFRVKG